MVIVFITILLLLLIRGIGCRENLKMIMVLIHTDGKQIRFGDWLNTKEFLLHNVLMQRQTNLIINYNNEAIPVKRDASLWQLMRNRKLMQCPLSVWKDLFIEKDGFVTE
jgi:hypothetical protein